MERNLPHNGYGRESHSKSIEYGVSQEVHSVDLFQVFLRNIRLFQPLGINKAAFSDIYAMNVIVVVFFRLKVANYDYMFIDMYFLSSFM